MVHDWSYITKSAQETAEVGEALGYYLNQKYTVQSTQRRGEGNATAICLYGELGSGKTTYVQGFVKGLGITSRLLSPTFIIVRRYSLIGHVGFLYHIDLYRLESKKDLRELGLSEILADKDSFVLIEWAEKLGSILPKERIDARFLTLEDGTHQVMVQAIKD